MQVLSAILFRVSLFNHVIIQKALGQITNMEHILSAKSLKWVQFPGCRPGYPSYISKSLAYNFHSISRVWCSNASK